MIVGPPPLPGGRPVTGRMTPPLHWLHGQPAASTGSLVAGAAAAKGGGGWRRVRPNNGRVAGRYAEPPLTAAAGQQGAPPQQLLLPQACDTALDWHPEEP